MPHDTDFDPLHYNRERVVRVTCWCEEQQVYVPLDEVWAGLTNPCRNDECRDRDRTARRGKR
jgi:hypothetical protein